MARGEGRFGQRKKTIVCKLVIVEMNWKDHRGVLTLHYLCRCLTCVIWLTLKQEKRLRKETLSKHTIVPSVEKVDVVWIQATGRV